jgi:hypothetical protein
MIILFLPGLGILAYLAVEVIPGLLRGRAAARLSQAVWAGLDPTSQYREFARAVETVPSIANLRALADECVRLGRHDEAIDLYKPTFARYPAVSRQDPAFDRLGQRQTAVAAGEKAARSRRSRATNAELGRFAPSYAHLPCRLLTAQHPCDAHAGAGGARSWAINDRMSANICLDTATSAIWKVT